MQLWFLTGLSEDCSLSQQGYGEPKGPARDRWVLIPFYFSRGRSRGRWVTVSHTCLLPYLKFGRTNFSLIYFSFLSHIYNKEQVKRTLNEGALSRKVADTTFFPSWILSRKDKGKGCWHSLFKKSNLVVPYALKRKKNYIAGAVNLGP